MAEVMEQAPQLGRAPKASLRPHHLLLECHSIACVYGCHSGVSLTHSDPFYQTTS